MGEAPTAPESSRDGTRVWCLISRGKVAVVDAVTAALIGSLGGAAVGGLIGFVGTRKTIQAQVAGDQREQVFRRELDTKADARRLRDARRERLRRRYEALVMAAITANDMVRNTRFVLNIDQTVEQRDQRLGRIVADAWRGINAARVALLLETDGREVLEAFDKDVYSPFQSFRTAYAINLEAKGSIGQDEFDRIIKLVDEGVERVVMTARERLDALQQIT